MRTAYTRTFFTATVVLVVSLLVIGFSLRLLLENHLNDSAFDRLESDSQVIADLAAAYHAQGSMSSIELQIDLEIAGKISGADAIICDTTGTILLCSGDSLNCGHQGMAVDKGFLENVIENDGTRDTGVTQGLYDDARYVCASPIRGRDGQVIGIVIVSQSIQETQVVLRQMTETFFLLSVIVVVVSVPIIGLFVNRQIHPLKEVARTASDFGHGNFNARVAVRSYYPQEVEELALSFNNMAASIQKGEYQRQEFVANVSHELKTPMTTIGGYIDGILDGTIPPEKSRYYMQIVSDETKRLSRLVRSMLDISQLQDQARIPDEKRTHFDLAERAGQVLITFEQKINAKSLQVEVGMPEHPVYTFANADYVTQVIYNLLDNAVKFCPDGGTLGLRIREQGSKALISIYNDGQTIPPEELPLVFDRFHKLDKSRSQNRDGWGLGLYIVKTIVCSHGEDISVTSRNGRTEFTFTMPLVL